MTLRLAPMVAVVFLATLLAGCGDTPGASSAAATPAPGATSRVISPIPGQSPSNGVTDLVATATLAADGSASTSSSRFDPAVARVFVVAALSGVAAGTKLSYVRYVDGHYVDSRSATVGKGARFFHFVFEPKPGKQLLPGHYLLRLYVDEHAVREISYTIGT